jgi:hypothetical protein
MIGSCGFSRPARGALADRPRGASPQPGVERKRFDLVGSVRPRLTTLVRFAPGSHFAEHGHDGGEVAARQACAPVDVCAVMRSDAPSDCYR